MRLMADGMCSGSAWQADLFGFPPTILTYPLHNNLLSVGYIWQLGRHKCNGWRSKWKGTLAAGG